MPNIIHTIETGGPGGAENFLIRLVEKLNETGWTNTVFLLKEGWLRDQLVERGVEVIVHSGGQGLASISSALFTLSKRKEADVIHSHEFLMNACVGLIAPFVKANVVTTVHGKGYYGEKLQRRILYKLSAFTTKMVAVSEDIKGQLVNQVGVNPLKVKCIANGIDVDAYDFNADLRISCRNQLSVEKNDTMILAVGNLYPVKGHKYLLEALANLKVESTGVKVFIAGRGQCEKELIAQIKRLKLESSVFLLGFRDDIISLLMASDIFCMPSLSEGLPLSILEAMAASKPVVATDVGGVGQVVLDGSTGMLVPSQNPIRLSEALEELINDSSKLRELGRNGRTFVGKNFAMNEMVGLYKELYKHEFD